MSDSRALLVAKVPLYSAGVETAKLFQHRGCQAVSLPEAFSFDGTEVVIERRGDEVVLKPLVVSGFRDFGELAASLAEMYPGGEDFPEPPERPREH
jgi:virulence-associated protein VagC